jgi:hypothetical protein
MHVKNDMHVTIDLHIDTEMHIDGNARIEPCASSTLHAHDCVIDALNARAFANKVLADKASL